MEEERFLTGYCKALDQSRMVAVVIEQDTVTEVDCGYPTCPHTQSCPIAEQINQIP